MVHTAVMSDARQKYLEYGQCLAIKKAQLITIHSYVFKTNFVHFKVLDALRTFYHIIISIIKQVLVKRHT